MFRPLWENIYLLCCKGDDTFNLVSLFTFNFHIVVLDILLSDSERNWELHAEIRRFITFCDSKYLTTTSRIKGPFFYIKKKQNLSQTKRVLPCLVDASKVTMRLTLCIGHELTSSKGDNEWDNTPVDRPVENSERPECSPLTNRGRGRVWIGECLRVD